MDPYLNTVQISKKGICQGKFKFFLRFWKACLKNANINMVDLVGLKK